MRVSFQIASVFTLLVASSYSTPVALPNLGNIGLVRTLDDLPAAGRLTRNLFGRSPESWTEPIMTKLHVGVSAIGSAFSSLKAKVVRRGLGSPFGALTSFGSSGVSSLSSVAPGSNVSSAGLMDNPTGLLSAPTGILNNPTELINKPSGLLSSVASGASAPPVQPSAASTRSSATGSPAPSALPLGGSSPSNIAATGSSDGVLGTGTSGLGPSLMSQSPVESTPSFAGMQRLSAVPLSAFPAFSSVL